MPEAAIRLLGKMVPSTLTGAPPLPGTAATLVAGLASAAAVLYVAFLRHSSRGPTKGFNRLRSKAAGSGVQGRKWTTAAKATERGAKGVDIGAWDGGVQVTWLGERELRVLEALGDTLLPGFEVETTEGADATVEQAVAVIRSNLFKGKPSSSTSPQPVHFAPSVETYARTLARRCLEMHGRPASDVGVAGLLAQSFEANISHEQRSGLQVLLWVLSTRLGALVLTGRAVPLPSQSLAARHALLKRWSVSRIGKFREAFQGVKRLSCSLYFSAHPEVPKDPSIRSTAATAAIKTNPSWADIRYEPQHHRIARDSNNPLGGGPAAKPGLWSGAKLKVAQAARAAAAATSPTAASSNPPSPCSMPSSSSSLPYPARSFGRARSKSAGNNIASPPPPPPEELPPSLAVDVVVVGSGAGGGCAAGALAARGLKVAVLEKGGLYDTGDFAGFSEMEGYKNLYEGQGVLASDDGAVVILAGSCVGGGTTVNWSASFRTPRHVRLEWARKLGLKSFELGGPYDKALDAVCERLGVNTEHSHRAQGCPTPNASLRVNQHQSSLWNGALASGLTPRPVARNARGCVDCGSCMHGCASGNKRSTHATWLQDGLDSGKIMLIPDAKVDRVLMDAGRATGVTATVTPRGGGKVVSLTVQARAVVVSGGAIHTPAILLRSGLTHPLIGRHLRLHPVLLAGGVFPEDYRDGTDSPARDSSVDLAAAAAAKQSKTKTSTEPKSKAEVGRGALGFTTRVPEFGRGVMMGVYVQDWMKLNGGYGCVIQAPPCHPGLMALVLPWNDALSHRYKLGKEDSQVIVRGRSEMLRLMRNAGASMLVPAHEGAPWFCPGDGKEADERFEEYVQEIESLGTTANEAGVYSAHQMGSCRLSATPEGGPLRETGEAWECDGLFVADASVLPTSLGINPMITVEAVAFMVAEQVATRLGKKSDAAPKFTETTSPLKRRLSDFGKAVASAITRDNTTFLEIETEPGRIESGGEGQRGNGDVFPTPRAAGKGGTSLSIGRFTAGVAGMSPRSPAERRRTVSDDADFGVQVDELSW
eukprot:jgi/Undpi1/14226/HiC_scaffold_9.g03875.m1